MEKQRIRFSHEGDPSLLVLTLSQDLSASGEAIEVFGVPLFARRGGLLIATPEASLAPSLLAFDEEATAGESLVGPGDEFSAALYEDTDEGLIALGLEGTVQVFDMADSMLQFVREYDPVTDFTEPIRPFHATLTHSIPHGEAFLGRVRDWMKTLADGGSLFYSAQEDLGAPAKAVTVPGAGTRKAAAPKRVTQAVLLEKLDALAGQMQVLVARQDQLEEQSRDFIARDVYDQQAASPAGLPSVSAGLAKEGSPQGLAAVQKAMALTGPPPRHRDARMAPSAPLVPVQGVSKARGDDSGLGGSNLEAALVQQSTALTSLVAHLAAQSPDSIGELNMAGSSSQTAGTRGVLRREKMQSELASRTGGFYLQLMQQMHRRLHPGKPVPQSLSELQSLSMLAYLERQGGYRTQRETGLVMWLLGHVVDAINAEDWMGVRELVALTVVAIEQSAVDQGDWSLAFLLALVSDPPIQMFQDRTVALSPHGRPFAPLCPASWAATTLGYLKDMETLSTKKSEIAAKPKGASLGAASPSSSSEVPSPKRKTRYPKKAKQTPEGA